MNVEIVSIGNILKETIITPDYRSLGPVLGSPCAYSSLIMAKLGQRVGMVTYFGDDYPKELDVMWQLRLVDKKGFMKYPYTTQNHLIFRPDGTKTIEYNKVDPVIEYKNLPQNYYNAKLFFICPMNYEVSLDLCNRLKDDGKTLMVDLGGFGGVTSYNRFTIDTARGEHIVDSLCNAAKIIKASEDDLQYLTPKFTIEKASNEFLKRGAEIVIITLGEKGAFIQESGGDPKYFPAFKPRIPEEELNLVGGGDAFAAGFIVKYIESMLPDDSVVYGNAVASIMIENEGACIEDRMPSSDVVGFRIDGII